MKIPKTVLIAGIVTLFAILIANIIATEYRIKREAKLKAKEIESGGAVCPPCPICDGQPDAA